MACPALERHYSPQELAEIWGVNEQTIRCMFAAEPGILRINVRRISRGAQREMLPLPLALVADVAPVASQAFSFRWDSTLPYTPFCTRKEI